MCATPWNGQQVVHAERVERDRPRDDQLVVAVVVGKGGRAKRLRREQLGIRVGHPAGRLLERLGVDVGAERAEQVRRRALYRAVVDATVVASIDTPIHGERKLVEAGFVPGHARFASAPGNFLRIG